MNKSIQIKPTKQLKKLLRGISGLENQNSQRGEGGVGFLVRECLVDDVMSITDVHYEESVWMKVRGWGGSSAMYMYIPTDCKNSASMEGSYEKLKKRMYLVLREREGWY